MNSIESLNEEQAEAEANLARIKDLMSQLKEEIKVKAEAEKEIEVKVIQATEGGLLVESLRRVDVLAVWKTTQGSKFKGYGARRWDKGLNYGAELETPARNLIPIKEWPGVIDKLFDLPRLTVTWEDEAKDKYDWLLNAPSWLIDSTTIKGNLAFKITAGPGQTQWTQNFRYIPGADWNHSGDFWEVPASEGWRIWEKLQDVDGVEFTKVAKILIIQQVEQRSRLDKIAKQEDSTDERIFKLTRIVWNNQKQLSEPFHDWLLPFQRVGIEFGLESGVRYVLGDKTGLGKTAQMIAIAEILRMDKPEMQTLFEVKGANIRNWVREIKNLTGEDPVICENVEKAKHLAYHQILGEKRPYILISHDMLGTYEDEKVEEGLVSKIIRKYPWVELFKMIDLELIGVDEAHKIKSPDAQRTLATHQLVGIPRVIEATATPILNRVSEWWSLLHMTDPILFPSFQQFKNDYTYDGQTAKDTPRLMEMLRPRFIQRLKKDVQKDLPPINRQTRLVALSDQATKDYKVALAGLYRAIDLYYAPGNKPGDKDYLPITNILVEITRLKQICAADKVDYVAELALELIDQAEPDGGKVLIFSQFKGPAYRIAQLLGDQAVCTVNSNHNSLNAVERDDLFERSKHNERIKFIVTTEAAQEGHNLEFCDFVIFNDQFWTPAAHDQCEGRAYGRLSNPHTIDSFYVIADVDIEVYIQELLDRKLATIEEAVTGVESSRELGGSLANELIKRMRESMG
ncbi:MAG: SNF2-related protein [Nitrososphaerales archaeon]